MFLLWGRRFRLPASLLFLALPAQAHDYLIVPGQRVGPIIATSTESTLRKEFGAAFTPATIRINPTTSAPGAEIYSSQAKQSIAVVWPRQEKGLWWPLLVIPCYRAAADCQWHTREGIRPGLSVAELERRNGKPFLLYPSPEARTWTYPYWNSGALAVQLGEDIDLAFDEPAHEFTNGPTYTESAARPLRIDRMLVYLLSAHRAAPPNGWTIVFGQRIGPIPMHAELAPLRETLGAAQVHRIVTQGDEGIGDLPGIDVFHGNVVMRPDSTSVCGGEYKGCRWHIAGGIPLGGTLAEFARLNGLPFTFNGCCFDLGGIITSWEGGKLAQSTTGRFVVSCPHTRSGDVELHSNDPDILKQRCTVSLLDF